MDIKILVAAHKAYRMPVDDVYLPIHVGKEGKDFDLGFIGDDTGDNISGKNDNYCELTALYWAWKNLKADYVGLAHYRRHFSFKKKGDKWDSVLTANEARELCEKYDVIVTNKRRYYIETIYSHYIHSHKKDGLDMVIDIIKNDYPEYAAVCGVVMKRTYAHMFNMFIMKRELFDKYCKWLFEILFKAEKRFDVLGLPMFEARIFGYFSEVMLDIWLIKNEIEYYECPAIFMEKQNWLIKSGAFLGRKLFAKREDRYA